MPECQNCGSWVSEDYVRVLSPDGDGVEACPAAECDMVRRGGETRPVRERTPTKPTAAAGAEVASNE